CCGDRQKSVVVDADISACKHARNGGIQKPRSLQAACILIKGQREESGIGEGLKRCLRFLRNDGLAIDEGRLLLVDECSNRQENILCNAFRRVKELPDGLPVVGGEAFGGEQLLHIEHFIQEKIQLPTIDNPHDQF